MNHGKYKTKSYKTAQQEKIDRLFGPVEEHKKICGTCDASFKWIGRNGSKAFSRPKFCSRKCANSVGGKAKAQIHHTDDVARYTTVAWRHHKKECIICGEFRIVSVHHVNEDHDDNDPKNLVPLCPTHHQYMHSRYKELIEDKVNKYIGAVS